jgi:glycosyltransferase involved in cell wall biosynthesis
MPLSLPLNAMLRIEKFAKKQKILLLTDRTEWYSASEFKHGKFSLQYQQNNITNRYIIDRYWRVVSITTFIENYYRSKSIMTVRIPAIMDTTEFNVIERESASKRIILYAGNPGKKDSLDMMVDAVSNLTKSEQDMLDFRILGVTQEAFSKLYPHIAISRAVHFFGRVSRDEVKMELSKADFSILLRNSNERFARAGFPSKVAESMSAGVPMITNYTSDLSMYLHDEKNSIIVKEFSVEALKNALSRAINLQEDKVQAIRHSAFETAKSKFEYTNYKQEISKLLSYNFEQVE